MAGRVLSAANESKLRSALEALQAVLSLLDAETPEDEEAEVSEAVTKTDGGQEYAKADYIYTPSDNVSEWKLRIAEYVDGRKQVTTAQVGRAIAALSPGGFHGQRVDIPAADMPAVKRKLRTLWKQTHPDADAEDMPGHIAEAAAPTVEAALAEEFVPLVERAVRRDGTIPMRLIAPGWGSSGYYPAEVLERDGPFVFKAGLKSFWNHPTPTQEAERPEGDLRDLAAELVSNARWDANGPAGPGLYADAKVFSPYQEAVNELAPHIGVSIRATGRAAQGEVEGRKGPVIQQIVSARSVDLVTEPGAGGKIVQMFEAARGARQLVMPLSEEATVDEKQLQEAVTRLEMQNKELAQQNTRLAEALLLRETRDIVREALAGASVPDVTKARLLDSLSANPPVTEAGALDKVTLATRLAEAIKAEVDYLTKAAGYGSGRIEGMGSAPAQPPDDKAVEARMVDAFQRMGLSESSAKSAANGRGW